MQKTAAALLALAAACASAPARVVPTYFKAADAQPPKFPRAQFVVGVGSATSGAAQADSAAMAEVARQLSSQIQVESSSWASTTGSSDSQQFIEKIRLNSSFAHAELIRVVERTEGDGVFYALAALDRAQAEAALARDVANDEARFDAAADRALSARRDKRAGEFSAAADEAQQTLPAVESSYILRRAVLAHASAAEKAHVERRNALIAALVDSRARRVVDVRVEGPAMPALMQRAVNAVQKLGLRVAEGKSCDAEPADVQPDATELVLTAEETCGDGSFGPKCEVNVRAHARGCAGGGEGEARIDQARGAHTEDRERARQRAWDKVTSEVVDAAVKKALSGAISGGSR